MKKITLLMVSLLVCVLAMAQEETRVRPSRIPATPYPIEFVQPSGDTIVIRLIGDERWSCRTTEDGYVLAKDKKGFLCYAKLNCKGEYRPTRIVAHKPEARTKKELRYIEKMKKNDKLWRKDNRDE